MSSFSASTDETEPVTVGGLPLSITADATAGDPEGLLAQSLPSSGGLVDVSVLPQSASAALGVRGVVFTAAPQGDLGPSVRVAANYGKFANAYGADFGSRLRIVKLPACALTTPSLKECQQQTPVASVVNDVFDLTVEASVEIPAASKPAGQQIAGMSAQQAEPAGASVFALAAGASSESGDFTKTKMNEAVQWSAGGSAGGFSTSVSLKVPPVPGDLVPSVTLDYSSQSVDGLGSGTNNQSSEAGDGWSIGGVSFIERSYRQCKYDGQGGNQGDLCFIDWAPLSIVLNGQSTQIIRDSVTQKWDVADASLGWKVERLTGAANWAWEGEHFRITTMDGTQYLFGSQPHGNGGPGSLGGGTAVMPVYSNDANEPCFNRTGSGFANSWCTMGYRWNLDLVTDRFGNQITYKWESYRNNYGANGNTTVFGYDMMPVLREIHYGLNNRVTGTTEAAKIIYSYDWRCYNTNCTTDFSTSNWPDTPWDQSCGDLASTCPGRTSPTFWSVYRLTGIESTVKDAAAPSGWSTVDKFATEQTFPATGDFVNPVGVQDTAPTLWLNKVVRPNSGNETVIVVNAHQKNNAVVWGNDVGRPPMTRWRISAFSGPAGDYTTVAYSGEDCVRADANMSNAERNTKRCYPRWEGAAFNWYHKYVVNEIEQHDRIGGAPNVLTRYVYTNDAATNGAGQGSSIERALWHFDDNWLVPATERTHNQWRGYTNVRTIVGARDNTGNQQVTDTIYFRGMDADRSGGMWENRTVYINDGWGTPVKDHPALAGKPRLVLRKDGQAGTWVRMSRHQHEVLQFGHQNISGGAIKRWRALENHTTNGTHHPAGGPSNEDYTRYTTVATTWDPTYPLPLKVTDNGENGGSHPSGINDDVCTETTYIHDTAKWIIGLPGQALTTDCAGTGVSNILAGNRTYYDGKTSHGQLGTGAEALGRVTKTEAIKEESGGANVWIPTGTIVATDYDKHGRIKKAADGMDRVTETVYSPAEGGPVTSIEVSNALGHKTTTTMDVRFGLPKVAFDVNGVMTTARYDAQGRLLQVWKNNRPVNVTPDAQYEYVLRPLNASYIKTQVLGPGGTLLPASFEMFDGLLRPRRTETLQADGTDRHVSDIWYYATGGVADSLTFGMAGAPNQNMEGYETAFVKQRAKFTYNNLGEQTSIVPWSGGAPLGSSWNTTIDPQGHRTIATPPQGGTHTVTYTDARGNISELRQAKPTGGTVNTKYEYNRSGQLWKVTDPANSSWTYIYDKLGRKIQINDPDSGTSYTSYRNDGSVLSTKDAENRQLWYKYDDLGRQIELHADSASGPLLSTWEYDKAAFNGSATVKAVGQLSSTTRKDATGDFVTQINDYDSGYRPKKTTFTAPGFGVGGAGLTYETTFEYEVNGAPKKTKLPTAGDLAAEDLTVGYNSAGLPSTLDTNGYGGMKLVADTTYDFDGVVLQRLHGNAGKQVKVVSDFSATTRRLSKLWIQTEKFGAPGQFGVPFDYLHAWDPAGNLTSIDANKNGASDGMECFRYDSLRRLTEAWTQNSGQCIPQKNGSDAYWRTWEIDDVGNRKFQTDKNTDGSQATKWTYVNGSAGSVDPHQVGQITASGKPTRTFTYDNAGNMKTRTTEAGVLQDLTWDAEGHLKTVKEGVATVASYVYNTDGSRLLATNTVNGTTKTTLYLPDGTELEKTGTAVSGQRYLGGVAIRNNTGLKWTVANHQGTAIVQIDSANLSTIDRRRLMPYGESRLEPASWLGTAGYVGGTKDTPTGLTHLGAREYDPSIGRFVSVDPIMDLGDPQQWNPYTYSNSSPVTRSDPSGLKSCIDGEACDGKEAQYCDDICQEANYIADLEAKKNAAEKEKKKSIKDVLLGVGLAFLLDVIGVQDILDCFGGDAIACGSMLLGFLPFGRVAKAGKAIYDAIDRGMAAYKAWKKVVAVGEAFLKKADDLIANAKSKLDDLKAGGACKTHSFDPDTRVLMADGTTKRIGDIKVGDKVAATDPETGEVKSRTVERVFINTDLELTNVEVQLADGTTEVIETTANHPFWDVTTKAWTGASKLVVGHHLFTPNGEQVTVASVHNFVGEQEMRDLTVAEIHTYFVMAADTPVLVHNCGDAAKHSVDNLADSLDDNVVFHYTSEAGHAGVMDGGVITANSKGVAYFTKEMLSSKETSNALFMGRGGDRGTHLIAFRLPAGTKLAPGSQPNELMHTGSFRFTLDDVVFHGLNPFG